MGGTTFSSIRSTQSAALAAATPTLWPAVARFVPWEVVEAPTFEAWVDQTIDPLRVFEIEHNHDLSEEFYLDTGTDLAVHTETVLVAYPALGAFAEKDLDDILDQDLADIDRALGLMGGANYHTTGFGLHRCELRQVTVEERPAARILRAVFEVEYDRSMA